MPLHHSAGIHDGTGSQVCDTEIEFRKDTELHDTTKNHLNKYNGF